MKKCSRCGELKPFSEYGKDITVKSGIRAACKGCRRAADKVRRDNTYDPEKKHEIYSRYRQRHPESLDKQRKNYRAKHPDRDSANNIVNKAVARGSLVRPEKCSWCESRGRVEGAHIDYDKPYEVVWLCPRCHRKLDAALAPLRESVERLETELAHHQHDLFCADAELAASEKELDIKKVALSEARAELERARPLLEAVAKLEFDAEDIRGGWYGWTIGDDEYLELHKAALAYKEQHER